MQTTHYIYKIWFIDNPLKCYIGRTRNPIIRLNGHRNSKGNTYKDRWVKKNRNMGKELKMTIIAESPKEKIGELEKTFITIYKNQGYKLTNTSKGGDGAYEFTELQKRRCSDSKKGFRPSEQFFEASRNYWTGRPKSEESRRKMSLARKGRTHSQEYKDKMSETLKLRGTPTWAVEANSKRFIVTTPEGETIEGTNLAKFSVDNKLDPSHLSKVARGKAKSHKGYTARYIYDS